MNMEENIVRIIPVHYSRHGTGKNYFLLYYYSHAIYIALVFCAQWVTSRLTLLSGDVKLNPGSETLKIFFELWFYDKADLFSIWKSIAMLPLQQNFEDLTHPDDQVMLLNEVLIYIYFQITCQTSSKY